MEISRRNFIYKSGALTAGSYLVPSLALKSCNPAGKAEHVRLGYIGTEEHFRYHSPFMLKLKNTTVEMTSLDDALNSDFHAIFIGSYPTIKATHIVLLLEVKKDIITPYPLAGNRSEFNRIQEFLDRHDRRLGMLNPLYFYPAVNSLKDLLAQKKYDLSEIRVSCHPEQLVKDYPVNSATGTVAPLQRMISYISGKFPFSLFIEEETNDIRRWILDYGSFRATIQVDPGQTGWIMEADGPQLNVLVDHTGLLSMNDEVKPRHSPDPDVWKMSMIRNFQDFLQAVRLRTEPMVNSLDGLSAIILHEAAVKTLDYGSKVNL
jgi:predicted dehydrogenase